MPSGGGPLPSVPTPRRWDDRRHKHIVYRCVVLIIAVGLLGFVSWFAGGATYNWAAAVLGYELGR